jgi:hypothetical protein
LLHVSVTSNHHQADISVHRHDMFSAYSASVIMVPVTEICSKLYSTEYIVVFWLNDFLVSTTTQRGGSYQILNCNYLDNLVFPFSSFALLIPNFGHTQSKKYQSKRSSLLHKKNLGRHVSTPFLNHLQALKEQILNRPENDLKGSRNMSP